MLDIVRCLRATVLNEIFPVTKLKVRKVLRSQIIKTCNLLYAHHPINNTVIDLYLRESARKCEYLSCSSSLNGNTPTGRSSRSEAKGIFVRYLLAVLLFLEK
jgi:hypothetical protein